MNSEDVRNYNDIKVRIQNDTEKIVNEILDVSDIPPIAIILCGGYGRGEGPWIMTNDGLIPYNDYDITVIYKDCPMPSNLYKKVRTKLASEIGISWIDIDFISVNELKHLKSTIGNVDLVFGSQILYGNKDVFKKINPPNKERIGAYDIYKLYQTRMWTFLGSLEGEFRNLSNEDARFFKYQMAKAVLAACDMILVKNHNYRVSYRERVSIIATIDIPEKYKRLSKWALNEKLTPSSEIMSEEDVCNLYFSVKEMYCFSLRYSIGWRSKLFLNPGLTKFYFYFFSSFIIHDVYNRVLKNNDVVTKTKDIFIAQNFVFLANNDGKINEKYLQRANEILKKWGYPYLQDIDWNKMRIVVADARNNI